MFLRNTKYDVLVRRKIVNITRTDRSTTSSSTSSRSCLFNASINSTVSSTHTYNIIYSGSILLLGPEGKA